MKKVLLELYEIDAEIIIKITDSVFRIKTKDKEYILKYLENIDGLEAAYSRLNILNISSFVIPILNVYNQYISEYNTRYFQLTYYYPDDVIKARDLRLNFFLESLANLHNKSQYLMRVNEGFFEETYDYVYDLLNNQKKELDEYLFRIEALDYKSPSQWLMLMNNQLFYKAIDEAKVHMDKFKDLTKEINQLRVGLIYQNFDYSHILIKSHKIIGTQKLTLAPPIYDIKYIFDCSFTGAIDLTGFIKKYLNLFNLLEYEKEWLLGLLHVPCFNFKALDGYKEVEAIVAITRSIQHFKNAQDLANILTKDE